jgi:hypothetical protein
MKMGNGHLNRQNFFDKRGNNMGEICDFSLKMVEEEKIEKILKIRFEAENGLFKTSKGSEYHLRDLNAYISKDIEIDGTCDYADIHILTSSSGTLELQSKDGWKIEISNFKVNKMQDPSGNFRGIGSKIRCWQGEIEEGDVVSNYVVLEDLEFNSSVPFVSKDLDGFELIAGANPNFPSSTGYFKFERDYGFFKSKWEDILFNLYILLSFASSNFVNIRIHHICGPNDYKELIVISYNNNSGKGSNILWPEMPFELFKFINSTYDTYLEKKDDLNLSKIIHYYVWMKNANYVENRYLLGCILMEGLKHAYGDQFKKYKTKSGFFLKPNSKKTVKYSGEVKNKYFFSQKTNLEERYSFREIIEELYSEFNIKKGNTDFIKYRNEVIHQGKINLDYPKLSEKMEELELNIEYLILKILQFDGLYFDNRVGEWKEFVELVKELDE